MTKATINAPLRQHSGANGELTRRQRQSVVDLSDARVTVRMADRRGRVERGPFLIVEARQHGWSLVVHGYGDQDRALTVSLFDDETISVDQPGVLGG